MKFFAWYGKIGIGIGMNTSFARFDESGSCYGPYTLWFRRICWPVYWAVTTPKQKYGVSK